ncbi:MAG: GNAT family N-acetyltransferase [Tuberibacillus sp.]
MKVYEYDDPNVFYPLISPLLSKEEVKNSLPLGVLKALVTNTMVLKEQPFMAFVGEENAPHLVMLMTPPNHLILSGSQTNIDQTMAGAVEYVLDRVEIPSVIGSKELSEPFAELYAEKTGKSYEIEMSQRIYKLERVNEVGMASGYLRLAEQKDVDILAQWILNFAKEATFEEKEPSFGRERAERGIRQKSLYVWEDHGQIVSTVSKTKPTEKGITVSLVYTPPELRGKGYASSSVTALSQKLLDNGYEFCSLYTDLTNPTSNSIYQKIGYQPVADSMVYRFK